MLPSRRRAAKVLPNFLEHLAPQLVAHHSRFVRAGAALRVRLAPRPADASPQPFGVCASMYAFTLASVFGSLPKCF
jgi:hypothetical protein